MARRRREENAYSTEGYDEELESSLLAIPAKFLFAESADHVSRTLKASRMVTRPAEGIER